MAQIYKINKILFSLAALLFQKACYTNQPVQAVKIVNETETKLSCKVNVSENSIVYIHAVSTVCPRALVTSWLPGSYGNFLSAEALQAKPALPTWVRIGFDRDVTQTFIDDFFNALRLTNKLFGRIHPIRHGKFKKEFVITIGPYYTAREIEVFIEKANIAMYKKLIKETTDNVRNYV